MGNQKEEKILTKWSGNIFMMRLGRAARDASEDKGGDLIDYGLSLLNQLNKQGFEVRAINSPTQTQKPSEPKSHRPASGT